jgi:hypothetical protein
MAINVDGRGQVLCDMMTPSYEVDKLILVWREFGPMGLSLVFALIVHL